MDTRTRTKFLRTAARNDLARRSGGDRPPLPVVELETVTGHVRHSVCNAIGMQFDVEQVDLEQLADVVRQRSEGPLIGAISGRSIARDIVATHLGCSLLEAEQLVDTMISRGFVRLERDEDGRQVWLITKGN